MRSSEISRDRNRTRHNAIEKRRSRAETFRTVTSAQSPGTRERLESVFRAAPIGISLLSNRVFLDVNNRFCEMTGYPRDELIGRLSQILYLTQDEFEYVGIMMRGQVILTGTGTIETQWKRKNGQVMDVLLSSSAIERTDPPNGVTVMAMDITAAKEIEARLRQSEQTLQDAEAIAHVGSVRRDLRTHAIKWSDETYRIYGHKPGEVTPTLDLVWSHIHPEDRERFSRITGIPDGPVRPEDIKYRIIRKDGQVRTLHTKASIERDGSGTSVVLVGAIQDITDREKAEENLLVQRKKLRSLASELALAEERERRRIAVELHDRACQSLALAKMTLQSQLEAARPCKRVLQEVCHALDETMSGIRSLTFDLSSATLYRFGLEAALEELLSDQLDPLHSITHEFRTDRTAKPLTVETSVLLFQCVRELVINIVKHAHAKNVTVDVRRSEAFIEILVADDGIGFDADATESSAYRSRNMGLFFVRERLDYAGGTLRIDSRPSQGSRFTLTAPLDRREERMQENQHGREDSARR
jgi:PAS domain S-box-containing protein